MENIYDLAILGAGPAGICAAIYATRAKLNTIWLDKKFVQGGQIVDTYEVDNYPGLPGITGLDLGEAMAGHAKKLGMKPQREQVRSIEAEQGIKVIRTKKNEYRARAVIIACGATHRHLGIPGEEELSGMGVSYCATCDAAFFQDRTVVVVGGGNVSIDAARVSSRCTDAKISMFCLEAREKMPASNEEIEEALEEGIELNCGWGPKEVLEEDGHVSGVVFKKCTRVFDAQGRFSPEYDENDTVTVPCRHVIFSVGQAIDWGHMLDNLHVELRPNGGALANKLTYQTSEPDIFVGGDVYTGPKFAIDAIAAGREGAISLHRYVHEHCTLTIGRNRRDFIELDKENIKVETYDSSSRQIPPKADVKEQAKTFRDLSQSLTEE